MIDRDRPDPQAPEPQFDAMTARLLRREALRRAAEEMSTMSAQGLEGALARISAEVTAEAADRRSVTEATATDPKATPPPAVRQRRPPRPSKP